MIRDHDAARLGLPPRVDHRDAERLLTPVHGVGVERFADAGDQTEVREVDLGGEIVAGSLQHANRRRCGVEDVDLVAVQNLVPAASIELCFVDDAGDAVRERGDDAVRRPCHPPRVGRAPEPVAVVQVEHQSAGDVMGDDRRMNVDGAFRLAGRAAREVHERRRLGIGRSRLECVTALGEERSDRHHLWSGRVGPSDPDIVLGAPAHQHEFEVSQTIEHGRHLAAVQQWRRDQDLDAPEVHPLRDGIRPERREQRCEGALRFERAECSHVQIGDAAGEGGHAGAWTEAAAPHRISESVRSPSQSRIGDVDGLVDIVRLAADESERHSIASALADVSIDRQVRDVHAAGSPGPAVGAQRGPCHIPVERRHRCGVVDQPRLWMDRHDG